MVLIGAFCFRNDSSTAGRLDLTSGMRPMVQALSIEREGDWKQNTLLHALIDNFF